MYGRICGNICLMHRNAKRSRSGQLSHQSSKNARRLRGLFFFFFDPDDHEFKRILKNARGKLDISMPAAMPCRLQLLKHSETCCTFGQHNMKYACVVEADKSTRIRMEGGLRARTMKTTSQEKA